MAQLQQFNLTVPGVPGVRLVVTVEVVVDAPQAKPDLADVATLIADGLTREQIAQRYARPIRTIDKWMAQARAAYPDIPQAARGRAISPTSDSDR